MVVMADFGVEDLVWATLEGTSAQPTVCGSKLTTHMLSNS